MVTSFNSLTPFTHLEKCGEDVWGWEGCEDEGQECAEATIEDRRPDVPQRVDSSLVSGAWECQTDISLIPVLHIILYNTFMAKEIVSNMSCVINTEAHGDDQIDARDYVYGEAPEVNKSPNINLTEYEGH